MNAKANSIEDFAYSSDPKLITPDDSSLFIIRTPKSNANFFNLKDFDNQV